MQPSSGFSDHGILYFRNLTKKLNVLQITYEVVADGKHFYDCRMPDLVKFLDPIVEKIDSGNVGWNVTKDLVSVILDVSNMASGSKWSSADIASLEPRRFV